MYETDTSTFLTYLENIHFFDGENRLKRDVYYKDSEELGIIKVIFKLCGELVGVKIIEFTSNKKDIKYYIKEDLNEKNII